VHVFAPLKKMFKRYWVVLIFPLALGLGVVGARYLPQDLTLPVYRGVQSVDACKYDTEKVCCLYTNNMQTCAQVQCLQFDEREWEMYSEGCKQPAPAPDPYEETL